MMNKMDLMMNAYYDLDCSHSAAGAAVLFDQMKKHLSHNIAR